MPQEPAPGYTARHLSVLEGLEAVRKRPGMYIGSTDGRGLMHCLWEILDNAVDEALAGVCTQIDVVLRADDSIEVRDDGRGIPVDIEPRTKLPGVELVFTRLHAGGKFGGGSYTATGGLHGVGASVVNALASRLDVEVDRGGKTQALSFRHGVPGVFDGPGRDAGFAPKSGLRTTGKVARKTTGARVRWWLDRQVFTADAEVATTELATRLRQTSYMVPGLTLSVRDERGEETACESYRHDGGIAEYCEYLASDERICDPVRLAGSGHFTETVPVLEDDGHMTPQDLEREVSVDAALRWGTGYDSCVRSFVNIVATPKGGTHVQGFERALTKTVNEHLRTAKVLKSSDSAVLKDDVLEGLTAVVTVRLPEPQFEGQTKEVLGTPAASRIVAAVIGKELRQAFAAPKRGQKAQLKAVLEKVANAARTRVAARVHRENQRRKNALESSALPAKLVDCRSTDVDSTELFIVEGDSALGTAKLARDSEFQA
ncbi:MAG: ATP-binding protein, partial [Nocardioidaceae bacterium]